MPDLPPLIQRVVADISGFQKGMAEARGEMDATSSKGGGFVSGLKEQLGGVGLAVGAMGLTFAKFALDSAQAFAKTTAEVRNFQRASGASAEDSSKLVAASKELGISSEAAANGMFRLGRNVAEHSDKLKADGVEIARNRQGNTDLVGTLFNVADAYNHTSDQAQKNKIVMDAFGRTGAQLIPILQRGRDGLKDLFAEAEKHHQIFDNAELQKGKEFSLAIANLHQTFQGLETEVGSAVVPTFTDFAHMATTVTEKIDTLNSVAGGKGGGFLGKLVETIAQDVDPALLLFGQHSDKTKQQLQDLTETEQKSQLATGLYGQSQQEAAGSALDRMVATGRLTQSQLDQNVALHLAKDGSLDYMATLKELDPAEAKQVDLLARQEAGLGDVRSGYERSTDAANLFKAAVESSFGVMLSADEAARRQADAERQLSQALQESGGSIDRNTEAGNRAGLAFDSLLHDVEANTEAQLRNSNGTMSAAQAKANLIGALQGEEARYPGLRGQIEAYIATIAGIPPEQLFTAYADTGQAIANIDQLRAHIAALRAESNQPIVNVGGGQIGVQAGSYSLRAAGGPVEGGQTYLVGEHGPELFRAPASGWITSNEDLGNARAELARMTAEKGAEITIKCAGREAPASTLIVGRFAA